MQKSFAIFVVSLLLFNIGGFLLMFEAEQCAIQSVMGRKIAHTNDEQLEKLTLSLREYESSKIDEHEIRFKGKMYDVARIESKNDSVNVYCIHDTEEEDLFIALEKFFEEQQHKSSTTRNTLASQLIQLLTLSFVQTENVQVTIFITYQNFTHQFTSRLLSRSLSVEPPPPKMLI